MPVVDKEYPHKARLDRRARAMRLYVLHGMIGAQSQVSASPNVRYILWLSATVTQLRWLVSWANS
jgi:hypothetical protein